MEVGRVGGCEVQEGPGDYYASRWSAVDGIDRWPKNLPKKEKLGAYRASRWSAVRYRVDTTKQCT